MSDALSERVTVLPNGKNFLLQVSYAGSEANGVKFLVAVSIFSFLAVLGLLVSIAISAWNTRKSINPHMFVRSHSCAYLVSMLLCDLLQAIGSIMNSAWTKDRSVEFGTTCVAQGVIKHLSDVGPAIWSLVIAMHTFWILFLRRDTGKKVFLATLVGAWSLIALLVLAGPATVKESKNGSFYGISGHWCWISDGYPVARIMADYFWMFLSAGICFIIYGLILLKLRGNITTEDKRLRFRLKVKKSELISPDGADSQMKTIAKQMLLYPIAYTIMFLPIACCRFVEWSGHNVSWGATIFSDAVFLLAGLVNVILFITTRRVLPPHTVITKRISLPAIATAPFMGFRRTSENTLVGSTVDKNVDIEEASIDLEKGMYLDHTGDVIQEVYTMEYNAAPANQESHNLTVPPVSPLRPEMVTSATLTVTFPNTHLAVPSPNMPVPAPAPSPIRPRQFHEVPLNTPVPGAPTSRPPRDGDDDSDYSSSPSTAGYPLSSPGTGLSDHGLNRLSAIPLPNPHSNDGHAHTH